MTLEDGEKNSSISYENFSKYSQSKQDEQNDILASDSRRYSGYIVSFLTQSRRYCVGMVDMINSTRISAQIGPLKASRYYEIFLNSMAKIIVQFSGVVIKNIGDCLVYYFPESDRSNTKSGFSNCIRCSLAMIESQKFISQQLVSEGLPSVDFRISSDYGSVTIMKSNTSDTLDMIGSPLNMCSKINRIADKNQFVIGGDLFQMVKEFKCYQFKTIKDFSLGFKLSYPVYLVLQK
jgi:class 3 adenylate cyclase